MRSGVGAQSAVEGRAERGAFQLVRIRRYQRGAALQALSIMKIIVCIKQVPAKDSTLRIAENGAWIRDADISFEINEPDAYALEAALRLKEQHGGEVVALSAGPARVETVLREALAKGADRAILLEDDAFARLDAFNGAKLLAKGLSVTGESYDL